MREPVSELPLHSSTPKRSTKPKYRKLLDTLSEQIRSGKFTAGAKLPSEAALVKKFAVSRITAGRALRELQVLGLIERVAGSGSFVRSKEETVDRALLFGLLIPDLGETEIFEPVCTGIANAPEASDHALLWGHFNGERSGKEEQARELCRQYLAREVSGVFFAPLEFEREAEKTNRAILAAFQNAKIPVVLLDHRPARSAEAKRHDLVGINNRQAGYTAAEHLINLGCRRIGFLGYHGSASTVAARLAGYEAALHDHGLPPVEATAAAHGEDRSQVTRRLDHREMEAWVCINDRVAGQLMHTLMAANIRVPQDVRVVGIDDAGYAGLLPVPLTTVRQPCRSIGEAALATMLERIRRPSDPAHDLLLDGELIVRLSCGARQSSRVLQPA